MKKNVSKKRTLKIPIAEQAYSELKKRILENQLPPGQQLMEGEIADLLEISRTPAREAMMKLEADGLVEVRPRHGMKVKPVSVTDMNEIYALLIGLESTAAWQAAQQEQPEKDIQYLRDCVKKMDDALETKDLINWAKADEAFHKQLVAMSRNDRLIDLVNRFIDQSHRVRMLTLRLRPLPRQSNQDHAKVVEAIASKQAEKARQIHRIHREKAGKLLIELLKSHGLTQL